MFSFWENPREKARTYVMQQRQEERLLLQRQMKQHLLRGGGRLH